MPYLKEINQITAKLTAHYPSYRGVDISVSEFSKDKKSIVAVVSAKLKDAYLSQIVRINYADEFYYGARDLEESLSIQLQGGIGRLQDDIDFLLREYAA